MDTPFRDPLRPLFRASILARVLAVGQMCVAVLQIVPAALAYRPGDGSDSQMTVVMMLISGVFMLLTGSACFVVGIYVRRRKFWAILAGMVGAAFLLLLSLYMLFDTGTNGFRDYPVESSIVGLFGAGFAVLLVQLIRGFLALRHDPAVVHGFTPLMPAVTTEVKHD